MIGKSNVVSLILTESKKIRYNESMKNTLQKVTSRGQITLPIAWRKKYDTNMISVRETESGLFISPAVLEKHKEEEYTVFDAIRDNSGKGIKARDLVTLIKKIK